ncbi:MAG: hypothetical protein ACRDRX_12145 [Pseudonocardiaceae bacterium]
MSATGGTAAVRGLFTAAILLVFVVAGFWGVLTLLWTLAVAGEPGFRRDDAALGMGSVLLVLGILLAAVVAQLKWANRPAAARTVALRSLLILAAPAAVLLFLTLRAS